MSDTENTNLSTHQPTSQSVKTATAHTVEQLLPTWWKFWKTVPVAWKYITNTVVPGKAKLAYLGSLVVIAAYVISPIDLLPEFLLPLIGYFDDIGSIPAVFAATATFNRWCAEFIQLQLNNKQQ